MRNVTIGFFALGFSEKPASGSSFGSATMPVWMLAIFIRSLRTEDCSSHDRPGRLRHGLPEFAVMSEKDPRAGRFAAGQLRKRGEHSPTVVDALRQSALTQGLAEIAGIGNEHDVARSEPHLQRLVPWGMTVSRQADNAAVAEQIVLAIDLDYFMPEVEIGSIEPALCGDVGVHSRFPLASLNDHHRVGNERIAADMVEVKMRIDDDVDSRGSRSITS